jgi:hypothetical protein
MLLEAGSDPMIVSKYGDDILQTACLKGNLSIFNYLMENVSSAKTHFTIGVALCQFMGFLLARG